MAAVGAASSESEQAAAGEPKPTPAPAYPPATLDPQLFMAARHGHSKLLKDLLQLKDNDEAGEQATRDDGIPKDTAAATSVAAAAAQVSIDVEAHRHSGAPSPPATAAVSASSPPCPVLVIDEDGVTMEGDSLLHVVAACGDTQEYLNCAKMIVREKKCKGGARAARLALEARNNKGDTPLHCAAGAGNANMIGCLTDLVANTADDDEAAAAVKKAFLRMLNEVGEAALHQAVRAAKVACIDQLMAMDSELACIPGHGKDGASPLYLAISLGEVKIAQHLCSKSKGKLSYSGPDGRNVLHAAVHRGQALPMILGWLIKDVKPRGDGAAGGAQARSTSTATTPAPARTPSCQGHRDSTMRGTCSVPVVAADCLLLTQLTSQRDKQQKGSTPLHLAASLEGWPDARFLFTRFPQVKLLSMSNAALLLDANLSTAYQADDEGGYPIHIAAHAGSLGVVKMLLERCPDCATLRDGEGRTFLHVAAEKERLAVVRYVVSGEMPQRLSSMILNAQDSNGDTALHGAVRAGNLAVFKCFLRNRRVRLDVENKDRMTPLDLSGTMIPPGFQYELNPTSIVRWSLLRAEAPHGGARPELFFAKHIPKRDLDKESAKHTEAAQVMSIVTALIATVTFASAFTLPGGYRSADSGDAAAAGTPVLAGSYAFDAFILADTLAFICSISSTCTLVYVGFPSMDISIRFKYLGVSVVLLQSAARSLVAAFGLGLYLVLVPFQHTASTIAACAIVFASSLYGNIEAWRMIRMATTVVARIGIRRCAVVSGVVRRMFFDVLVHFGSYVIIFGVPAISKWVIPAIRKWGHQKQL